MPRPILEEARIHPSIRERIARHQHAIVEEVQRTVAAHPTLVGGADGPEALARQRRAAAAAGLRA